MCIHISSYFEFQCNNWKNKARIFEYVRISRGGGGGGAIVRGVFVLEPLLTQSQIILVQ